MFGTNHSLSFLKLTLQFDEVFRSFPSIPHFTLIYFFVAGRNVCLSLCGGSHVAKSIFSNSAKRKTLVCSSANDRVFCSTLFELFNSPVSRLSTLFGCSFVVFLVKLSEFVSRSSRSFAITCHFVR